ncbi:hypothetical protein BCR34DRAFT_140006 [Clohesyomyces aquaticus]|uniref:Yeast cell wall synthesis Kre9/Knh1-like N-terminal domain-containing protein n=1 Tax=Clohesyomyces aquaticus TaxID=1231657 RepID=A0A1Y1YMH9_9PLEO|nr:hypothetical protein BCR34DRAFT_140006 [Clohesyomyces aquaticus]
MRMLRVVGTLCLCASLALAENLLAVSCPSVVEVGKRYNISWTLVPDKGQVLSELNVVIDLLNATFVESAENITRLTSTLFSDARSRCDQVDGQLDSARGGSYEWFVDRSLRAGDNYSLQLSRPKVVNYSNRFSIKGIDTLSTTLTTSSTPSPTPTPSPTSRSPPVHNPLTPGATAGIGAGATIAGIAILAISSYLFIVVRRWFKARKACKTESKNDQDPGQQGWKQEMDGNAAPRYELDAGEIKPSWHYRTELETEKDPRELVADEKGGAVEMGCQRTSGGNVERGPEVGREENSLERAESKRTWSES